MDAIPPLQYHLAKVWHYVGALSQIGPYARLCFAGGTNRRVPAFVDADKLRQVNFIDKRTKGIF